MISSITDIKITINLKIYGELDKNTANAMNAGKKTITYLGTEEKLPWIAETKNPIQA